MVFRIEITDVRDAGWGTGRRNQDPLTDPESRKWCFKLPFLLCLKFECATCQQIYTELWRHSLLMTMADAPPPPLQMLARPRLPSGRLCVMWAINREPDILKNKTGGQFITSGGRSRLFALLLAARIREETPPCAHTGGKWISQSALPWKKKIVQAETSPPPPPPPPITFLMVRP